MVVLLRLDPQNICLKSWLLAERITDSSSRWTDQLSLTREHWCMCWLLYPTLCFLHRRPIGTALCHHHWPTYDHLRRISVTLNVCPLYDAQNKVVHRVKPNQLQIWLRYGITMYTYIKMNFYLVKKTNISF